jgi:hypothetical protein
MISFEFRAPYLHEIPFEDEQADPDRDDTADDTYRLFAAESGSCVGVFRHFSSGFDKTPEQIESSNRWLLEVQNLLAQSRVGVAGRRTGRRLPDHYH